MTPSSPFRSVSSTASVGSAVILGSTIESDSRVCSRSPVFTTWLSTEMNLRSRQTVTSMLLIRQELECVDQIVTYSMWWSLCSEDRAILCDQDSVRVPPVVLTTTRSAPRVALLIIIIATFRVARLTLPTEKTLVGGCRARNASVTLACVSFHFIFCCFLLAFLFIYFPFFLVQTVNFWHSAEFTVLVRLRGALLCVQCDNCIDTSFDSTRCLHADGLQSHTSNGLSHAFMRVIRQTKQEGNSTLISP